MELISGQAIKIIDVGEKSFSERFACEDFCGAVNRQMVSRFQVKLQNLAPQLVVNSEFGADLSDWTVIFGSVVHSIDFGGSAEFNTGELSQTISADASSYYYIEIKIRDLIGDFVFIASGDIIGASGTTSLTDENGDFIIRIWVSTSASATEIGVRFRIVGTGKVEYAKAYKVENVSAELRTCAGTVVGSLPVQLFKDVGIISVDWSDMTDNEDVGNCYQICVFPDLSIGDNLINPADYNNNDYNNDDYFTG